MLKKTKTQAFFEIFFGLLVVFLFLSFIWFANVLFRGFQSYLPESTPEILIFTAIFGVSIALYVAAKRSAKSKQQKWFAVLKFPLYFFEEALGTVVILMTVILTILGYYAGLIWCIESVNNRTIGINVAGATAAIATATLGFTLFQFRKKMRTTYGLVEVLLGIFVGFQQVAEPASRHALNPSIFLPFLTAAVYLVVRGLDNMSAGRAATNVDFVGRWLNSNLRLSK